MQMHAIAQREDEESAQNASGKHAIILNSFSSFILQSPAGFTLVLIRYGTEMQHTLMIYDVQ